MTLFDMTGKTAVITGSTKGIGRAIAERMAEHGAKVVISSRKQDACDQVAKEINDKYGKGRAVAVAANISSKENLQNLVDESNKAFGKIDVVVCNAASNPYYGPMLGISDEQFRKIFENNVMANHWLAQLTAPEMVERKDGSIIIVSSIGGLRGSPVIGAGRRPRRPALPSAETASLRVTCGRRSRMRRMWPAWACRASPAPTPTLTVMPAAAMRR